MHIIFIIFTVFKHDFDTEDFSPGWILHRKKDISDYEWNIWIPLFRYLAPWLVGHLIGSELIRWMNVKVRLRTIRT